MGKLKYVQVKTHLILRNDPCAAQYNNHNNSDHDKEYHTHYLTTTKQQHTQASKQPQTKNKLHFNFQSDLKPKDFATALAHRSLARLSCIMEKTY